MSYDYARAELRQRLAIVTAANEDLARVNHRIVAEREEWRRCAEYALHLAQYGERAPGGNETWAELERMMRAAASPR